MNTRKNLGKLYKYNPLLLASIEVEATDSRKELSNNDILIFNYLLKLCQIEIRQKISIAKSLLNFSIDIEDFKVLFPNDSNWVRTTLVSFEKIGKAFITFKNVRLPKCLINNKLLPDILFRETSREEELGDFSNYKCELLTLTNKPKNKRDVFEFSLNPVIAYCIWIKSNYTHISLDKVSILRSRYAQKIYEFIEYYVGLHRKKNAGIVSISFGKKELKKLFNFDDRLPFSKKVEQINRRNILEKELSKIYEDFYIKKEKGELIMNLKYPKQ